MVDEGSAAASPAGGGGGAPAEGGRPVAVLLMAYGSPDRLEDVPAYYADVRGGRAVSPEALAELTARYVRIGGRTPLLPITRQLAGRIQGELDRVEPGGYRVHVGMRHWHPYIREAVADIRAGGAGALVALPLAPHYSRMSVGAYREALEKALAGGAASGAAPAGGAAGSSVEVAYIERWHDAPGFRQLIADRVAGALRTFPPAAAGRVKLLFSAHSLPERIRAWGDPYADELRESAGAIAGMVDVATAGWEFAFQSAGRTGDGWLQPDISAAIARLGQQGCRYVLSVPFGFVCDHLEILYDVDIEAQATARASDVLLRRIPMPNADPALARLLAALVRRQAAAAGFGRG